MNDQFDVVVIGEGVAGLTAAGLLARRGMRVVTFEAAVFGGLVLNLNHLDPAPAGAPASGAEYASDLLSENMDAGVARFEEAVTSIASTAQGTYRVGTESRRVMTCHVVVATGARWKALGVPNEQMFEGAGISHCADCDGPMYAGQDVVVVGGGDSAVQEAIVLSDFVNTVHIVTRGDGFTAQRRFTDGVAARANVRVTYNATVESIIGSETVAGVRIRSAAGHVRDLACTGVFPFVGLTPNAEFLPKEIQRDTDGRVLTDDRRMTVLPNVWAIGAVRAGGDGLLTGCVNDAHTVVNAIAARR